MQPSDSEALALMALRVWQKCVALSLQRKDLEKVVAEAMRNPPAIAAGPQPLKKIIRELMPTSRPPDRYKVFREYLVAKFSSGFDFELQKTMHRAPAEAKELMQSEMLRLGSEGVSPQEHRQILADFPPWKKNRDKRVRANRARRAAVARYEKQRTSKRRHATEEPLR